MTLHRAALLAAAAAALIASDVQAQGAPMRSAPTMRTRSAPAPSRSSRGSDFRSSKSTSNVPTVRPGRTTVQHSVGPVYGHSGGGLWVPEHYQSPMGRSGSSAPAMKRERGSVRLGANSAPAATVGTVEVGGATAGAAVYVNGRLLGKTPLRPTELEPGEYQVKVAKYGFKAYEAPLVVEAGETARLEPALKPLR